MRHVLKGVMWIAAPVALISLLFLCLTQSPPGTGTALVPEPRAVAEVPTASGAASLAGAHPEDSSAVEATQHGDARLRELRVTEAGSGFMCRTSHFALDANGRVVRAARLLSVSGDSGREVITVALGRRREITPTRLRELGAHY